MAVKTLLVCVLHRLCRESLEASSSAVCHQKCLFQGIVKLPL